MGRASATASLALLLLTVAAGRSMAQEDTPASPVKSDEEVLLFPTYATQDPETGRWTAAIHGWIFEPEPDSIWRGVSVAALRTALGLDRTSVAGSLFAERARWFLADNERGKEIPITVAGHTLVCGRSGANGHFFGLLELSAAEVDAARDVHRCQGGCLPSRVVLPEGDDREMTGTVHLVTPRGLSVISDIDDTIKISQVTSKKELIANTFLRSYRAVAGMPELYQRWLGLGASFHYVSSSPWQLTHDLGRMIETNGLPAGTLHLKTFRWKDETVLDLLASSTVTKPPILTRILQAYPGRRFLLVGDSGEHDPAIYGDLARAFPEQVVRIFIRNVTAEEADSPRMLEAFRDLPRDRWQLFDDPAEVTWGTAK